MVLLLVMVVVGLGMLATMTISCREIFCLPLLLLLHKLRAPCNVEEIDLCHVQVSSHLEKMGHSIGMLHIPHTAALFGADALASGTRLIDEMLAKTSMGSCADFKVPGSARARRRGVTCLSRRRFK